MYESVLLSDRRHIWVLGALRPAAAREASTKGEGHERRYFYGSVWAVTDRAARAVVHVEGAAAQHGSDIFKLVVFIGILAFVGNMARLGLLPRTRPIVPGELAVSD